VSTSAVDTWKAIKIWTENLTKVSNEFLLLTQVLPYNSNENSGTKFKNT